MSDRARTQVYIPVIEAVFFANYQEGATEVSFTREDIIQAAEQLGVRPIKNIGDVIYSFRFRKNLPERITQKAPEGKFWAIRSRGRGLYQFSLVDSLNIVPSTTFVDIKIPDATPGVIEKYRLSDEQALLAKLRYNRLIDVFTGLTCYSLQNHLRTTVRGMGQVETDEVYVGIDKQGIHYIIPVQAKGGTDRLGVVQIEQDIAMAGEKFPSLVCRAIGSQFVEDNLIALFEFVNTSEGVKVIEEKHYRLVSPEDLSHDELLSYRSRLAT